jgi:hypothetical protein
MAERRRRRGLKRWPARVSRRRLGSVRRLGLGEGSAGEAAPFNKQCGRPGVRARGTETTRHGCSVGLESGSAGGAGCSAGKEMTCGSRTSASAGWRRAGGPDWARSGAGLRRGGRKSGRTAENRGLGRTLLGRLRRNKEEKEKGFSYFKKNKQMNSNINLNPNTQIQCISMYASINSYISLLN